MREGQALRGPHGEIAEYLGDTDYFGRPGALIRCMSGAVAIPTSSIGTEWRPIPGRVVVVEHQTGRWTTPIERWLGVE